MKRPKVHLVGAGPGDPELLTLKAARLLREADVVVYDRLVAPEIMELVPKGAARIFVGKATSNHTLQQDEINELLVRLAVPGRRVVRLKGGDPLVFGRGGEEAEYLAAHGVDCEIVPGITAAAGCAAEVGIPLTHRGLATGLRFVTGHCRAGEALDLNWQSLADPDTTLVVYMGLGNLGEIATRLVAAGLPATTPAAAIANGTTPQRQICRATLADLPGAVAAARLASPVLVIIGRVAALARLPASHQEERHEPAAPARRA
ncbi:MAG: uroporphyrinogen-III C-methyltransferase [Rhodospirillales bacterium]|nr:uroporphyrinogen-III C-methyltransferase [Rhodospirillales bacterium]